MGAGHTTDQINQAMDAEVSQGKQPSSERDFQRAFPTTDVLRYIANDTFMADPSKLLGKVYYETKGSRELIPFHTRVTVKADPESRLTAPSTVSELIIESSRQASLEFLMFLSLSVGNEEVLELRVINNAAARAIDSGDGWDEALDKWHADDRCQALINDPEVTAISVVTGVIQKYLSSKKYRKFEAGIKGGYAGINVGGKLYTSSSEFQLDIVYGVDLVSFGTLGKRGDTEVAIVPVTKPSDIEKLGDKFAAMVDTHGIAVAKRRRR